MGRPDHLRFLANRTFLSQTPCCGKTSSHKPISSIKTPDRGGIDCDSDRRDALTGFGLLAGPASDDAEADNHRLGVVPGRRAPLSNAK